MKCPASLTDYVSRRAFKISWESFTNALSMRRVCTSNAERLFSRLRLWLKIPTLSERTCEGSWKLNCQVYAGTRFAWRSSGQKCSLTCFRKGSGDLIVSHLGTHEMCKGSPVSAWVFQGSRKTPTNEWLHIPEIESPCGKTFVVIDAETLFGHVWSMYCNVL